MITVNAEHDYQVKFFDSASEVFKNIPQDRELVYVSTEALFKQIPLRIPEERLILIPDGENQKSFSTVDYLTSEFARRGLTRSSRVVAVGGGATTDVVGFAASIYMRGVEWIAIPTSLSAMVDAAIGGKTGINIPNGKNLVGTFHSPTAVLISSEFLKTLDERDIKAGMAEVIKCGFISDPEILDLARDNYQANLEELIFRSVAVKAKIVSKDFKESDDREILNYGHTLGHAIESHSQYRLRHGEAISIGLIYAAELSSRFGKLDSTIAHLHRELLGKIGLPIKYSVSAWEALFALMNSDKKRRSNSIRFVTLDGLGVTNRNDSITAEQLEKTYLDCIAE